VKFKKREKELIVKALYIMECACYGDELPHDIERELRGTPKPDEIRELMERIKQ